MEIAARLATEAGQLVAKGRADAAVKASKSSLEDIVTQVDLDAEQLLRDRIAALRPDDAVLGEEGDDVEGTSGITWVLDPIDGTVNFLYGLPHFCVSVAAVRGAPKPGQWTQLAGAIAEAGDGPLWTAAAGVGAWRDGVPLAPRRPSALSQTLVATGFQYLPERRVVQGEVAARLMASVRDIRRLGSCALDLCYAAAGEVDAYYEHGLNAWDFAAGSLIAREVGLRVEGFDGAAADEKFLLAAPPGTFEELHAALLDAGARDLW